MQAPSFTRVRRAPRGAHTNPSASCTKGNFAAGSGDLRALSAPPPSEQPPAEPAVAAAATPPGAEWVAGREMTPELSTPQKGEPCASQGCLSLPPNPNSIKRGWRNPSTDGGAWAPRALLSSSGPCPAPASCFPPGGPETTLEMGWGDAGVFKKGKGNKTRVRARV